MDLAMPSQLPATPTPSPRECDITKRSSISRPKPAGNLSWSAIVEELRQKYWQPLEAIHKRSAWKALDSGYSDPNRAYHTWGHVLELLQGLDEFCSLCSEPTFIATAIFWHDAVYLTQNLDGSRRSDYENVRDSGKLFRRHTLLNTTDADAVHDLIMATANHRSAVAEDKHYAGFSGDLELLLDLDLSPLAAPWEKFRANLENIRFEYSFSPDATFYSDQLRILEGFLDENTRLYRRAETRKKWLNAAISNLKLCVAELRGRQP